MSDSHLRKMKSLGKNEQIKFTSAHFCPTLVFPPFGSDAGLCTRIPSFAAHICPMLLRGRSSHEEPSKLGYVKVDLIRDAHLCDSNQLHRDIELFPFQKATGRVISKLPKLCQRLLRQTCPLKELNRLASADFPISVGVSDGEPVGITIRC